MEILRLLTLFTYSNRDYSLYLLSLIIIVMLIILDAIESVIKASMERAVSISASAKMAQSKYILLLLHTVNYILFKTLSRLLH